MNKRLLLSLYDRSGLGAYMPVDYNGHELEVEEHMEKFAELIVQECVQVGGPEDSYTDEWFKAKADSVAKIKEHFGVEP